MRRASNAGLIRKLVKNRFRTFKCFQSCFLITFIIMHPSRFNKRSQPFASPPYSFAASRLIRLSRITDFLRAKSVILRMHIRF